MKVRRKETTHLRLYKLFKTPCYQQCCKNKHAVCLFLSSVEHLFVCLFCWALSAAALPWAGIPPTDPLSPAPESTTIQSALIVEEHMGCYISQSEWQVSLLLSTAQTRLQTQPTPLLLHVLHVHLQSSAAEQYTVQIVGANLRESCVRTLVKSIHVSCKKDFMLQLNVNHKRKKRLDQIRTFSTQPVTH